MTSVWVKLGRFYSSISVIVTQALITLLNGQCTFCKEWAMTTEICVCKSECHSVDTAAIIVQQSADFVLQILAVNLVL